MERPLLEMAKDLVVAQVGVYRLGPEAVRQALRSTHANLMMLRWQEAVGADGRGATARPVEWRQSITRYTVTCLECGGIFKQLSSRHLRLHGLDGRSYRTKYGIPQGQALVARESSAKRRRVALESRMWEKAPRY